MSRDKLKKAKTTKQLHLPELDGFLTIQQLTLAQQQEYKSYTTARKDQEDKVESSCQIVVWLVSRMLLEPDGTLSYKPDDPAILEIDSELLSKIFYQCCGFISTAFTEKIEEAKKN